MIKKVRIMSLALICVSLSGCASGNPYYQLGLANMGNPNIYSGNSLINQSIAAGMPISDAMLLGAEYDLKQQQAEFVRLESEAIQQALMNVSRSHCAENGSCYGDISKNTGRRKTSHVQGYHRKDGTYVRGHYRSRKR